MTDEIQWMKECDQSRVIDDFVYIMIFCGNDFMPQIPFLNIMNNIIQYIINVYKYVQS